MKTAEEVLNDLWGSGGLYRDQAIKAMKEYARLACEEQKEICSKKENAYEFEGAVWMDEGPILNAPLPELK